jgi:hypothetical protein
MSKLKLAAPLDKSVVSTVRLALAPGRPITPDCS